MMDDDVSMIAWIMYGGLLLLTLLYTALRRVKLDASKEVSADRRTQDTRTTSTYDRFKGDENDNRVIHTKTPSRAYGLGPEELAGSVLFQDQDDVDDDTTMRALRDLQDSDEFRQWCASKKMTRSDLQDVFSREHVYRKLREIHPESFFSLCNPSSLECVDVVDPTVLALLGEYLLSRCIDIGVCGIACMYLYAYKETLTQVQIWVCAAFVYAMVVRHWCSSRTSGSSAFSTWYETSHLSEKYYTSSGFGRSILANVLENVFVLGSGGLGLCVSLYTRCIGGGRQSIGERLAGVRLIVEQTRRLDR
mmetsp:Transcript_6377/g.12565  ORF Transcript_6377/g.12565 Transcript_6377/m.12565 type:complete len:306 (-) Transcript_6377:145-1062(-)